MAPHGPRQVEHKGVALTLRVCIMDENGLARSGRAPRYPPGDINQTSVLHERHEPAKESDVRDREGVSVVAPS